MRMRSRSFEARSDFLSWPRILVVLFILSVLSVASRAAAEAPDLTQRVARIENGLLPAVLVKGEPDVAAKIEARMAHHKVAGLAVAVINNFKIEWAKGYGVIEAGKPEPVDEQTLFQAGSISKPVAAMGALKLVERGLLSLDTPVNDTLKSWQLGENDFTTRQPVTLRLLLMHTAGTTVHGFPGYNRSLPLPATVQVLSGEPPVNTPKVAVNILPGSKWRYSGGGITVAQLMVMDVTGKPFAEFMRETVLDPIGMTRSTYEQPLPESLHANAARGHNSQGKLIDGGWNNYPELAAAGLWTTPVDLAKFAIELMLERKGESQKVLSRESAVLMTTGNKDHWGIGIVATGEGEAFRIAHGGSNAGFKCDLVAYPETGKGVAIMTNGDAGPRVAADLTRAVAREDGWADRLPIELDPLELDEKILTGYLGRYRMDSDTLVYTVSLDGGKLWIKVPAQPRTELLPKSATEFLVRDSATLVRFVEGEDGAVAGIRFGDEADQPLAKKF